MALALLDAAAGAARLQQGFCSALNCDEGLCDLLRAEIHARGRAPRSGTLERIRRLLQTVQSVELERLGTMCEALVRDGDLILAPGGVLWATPLRAVPLASGEARVFSSLSSTELSGVFGQAPRAKGASRTIDWGEASGPLVAAVGGRVLTGEMWAGLDRTPIADGAFLAQLDERLAWEHLAASSLERDGPLEWRGWVPAGERKGWRSGANDACLWWARSGSRAHRRAWTAGNGSPATAPFIELSPDETDRARFALSRIAGSSATVVVEKANGQTILTIPTWLPRPEFRWLSLSARPLPERPGFRWQVLSGGHQRIIEILALRLGLRWEEVQADDIRATFRSCKQGKEDQLSQPFGSSELPDPLDDKLPDLKAMGPLLRKLGISTYRDLTTVQLDAVGGMPGVGRRKVKCLFELAAEAERRGGTLVRRASAMAAEGSVALDTPRFNYDHWNLASALGRLPKRIVNVIESAGLMTVGELKHWHKNTSPTEVKNYGRRTHAHLASVLERLEDEGHESLVFGGGLPATLNELAERYIENVDSSVREYFELRVVQGFTLEQVGQQMGVTRERVRQIVKVEISETTPSWGPRAQELLEPMFLAFESGGGVAPTNWLFERLGSPSRWALELACQLAGAELLVDVIQGVSTSLPREEFFTTRGILRRQFLEVEALTADVVRGALTAVGISIATDELAEFSDLMFGITIDGDYAYLNQRSTQYMYIAALRDAAGPVSAEYVASRVNEVEPSLEASKRNAVMHFSRSRQAFSHAHGMWVHEDHLGVPREIVDGLAASCLARVEQVRGQAVSVRLLLAELVKSSACPAEVTPHILRDALVQTGRVRGWRSGTDVAWLGGDVAKTTISEWLNEVAPELEQPFSIEELAQTVALRSGYEAKSVVAQAYQAGGDLVPIGRGQYLSRRATWPDSDTYLAAIGSVEDAVSESGLWSADNNGLRIPGLDNLISRVGCGLAWGLATKSSSLATRELGLFMWPASHGDTLWSVIAHQFLGERPLFKPSALKAYLFGRGLSSEHVVVQLLAKRVSEGTLARIGFGWYIDGRLPLGRQVELLCEQSELRQLALASQDFVRESPLRTALNEVRMRYGTFMVPAG